MSPTDIAVLQNEIKHLFEKLNESNKVFSERIDKTDKNLAERMDKTDQKIDRVYASLQEHMEKEETGIRELINSLDKKYAPYSTWQVCLWIL
jgi:ElaB/YqjD/DUF883 family membrane-anchored ribosome-binding protein